jgi:hypothetical protein
MGTISKVMYRYTKCKLSNRDGSNTTVDPGKNQYREILY